MLKQLKNIFQERKWNMGQWKIRKRILKKYCRKNKKINSINNFIPSR
jgi:hypothetical protein